MADIEVVAVRCFDDNGLDGRRGAALCWRSRVKPLRHRPSDRGVQPERDAAAGLRPCACFLNCPHGFAE